ncbi:MAG: RHS repeat protein, partial [Nitrospirae bacterium]|nr:RHS repeat protein [Nitrospirota bacterium]
MTTNPDGTSLTAGYDKGKATLIDANGHKKVEEKDVYGRLIKVEEYTGISPSFSLYATTTYQNDVLGNLTKVIDAANNQTTITYDTLSRKISMTDPDMGTWTYSYDASGNLISQTDALSQTIAFTYDAVNRITMKDYPAGTDVIYTYDEPFSTNPKGRLTTVSDASGTTRYYYDKLGRVVKTIKTVDGTDYTTETGYDALGRTVSIKYPDNETVSYTYDTGGNLSQVTGYATHSGYNALGQAGTTTYGNGATTTYLYTSSNNRLYSITSNSPVAGGLQNLSYTYNNGGNITGLTDLMDSNRTQTFTYDDINRLTYAQSGAFGTLTYSYNQIGNMTYNTQIGNYTYGTKPHAVTQAGGNTYTYDANGNMTGGGGRTIIYDYDNRPSRMTYNG